MSPAADDDRYRALFEAANDGVLLMTRDRFIDCNNTAAELFGVPRERLVGMHPFEVSPPTQPDGRPSAEAAAEKIDGALAGTPQRFEWLHTRGGHQTFEAEVSLSRVRIDGEWILQALVRDISDRKRSERLESALRRISQAAIDVAAPNELYPMVHAAIAELMPAENLYICLYDEATSTLRFPYFVDETESGDDLIEPQPLGRGLTEYVIRTGKPLHSTPQVFDQLRAAGEVDLVGAGSIDWLGVPLVSSAAVIGVLAVQSYSERIRYAREDLATLQLLSGHVAAAIDRCRAEEALRRSERMYRLLAEASKDVIWMMDLNGRFTYVSPSVTELAGYTPDDVLATPLHEFLTPESAKIVTGIFTEQLRLPPEKRTPAARIEVQIRAADGSSVDVEVVAAWLLDDDGNTIGVQGNTRDISERKAAEKARVELEEQLRRSQKLEAVGRLAGGIAHDFNNLLTVIRNSAELAEISIPKENPAREALCEVREAARRATDLTDQLLVFGRKKDIERRPVNLDEAVAKTAGMLRNIVSDDIEIVIEASAGTGFAMLDPDRFDELLFYLADNARDAMPTGGTLTIHTGRVTIRGDREGTRPSVDPGDYVVLKVTDTGVGMDGGTASRAFDPFFTTKGVGRGSGLGLSAVHGIVEQHGGAVDLESTPGAGTTVWVYLPAAAETDPDQAAGREDGPPAGHEKILLIEDEAAVRRTVEKILDALGYTVVVADGPTAAIEIMRRDGNDIDAVLSDVVMPDMNGYECFEQLRRLRPDLKCLFMSGYTDPAVAGGVQLDELPNFIQKPFGMNALAQSLRRVLNGA